MEQLIIGIAGKKQSGKSTTANLIAGYILTQEKRLNDWLPLPKTFEINEDGKLIIEALFTNEDGTEELLPAELDLRNKDIGFINFAEQYIWPYVKIYSFADSLKEIVARLFGVTHRQLYGSNKDKSSATRVLWKDLYSILPQGAKAEVTNLGKNMDSYVSSRDLLQFFGTEICRTLNDSCWVDDCITRILCEKYPVAIIDDCRFTNEVKAVHRAGGKLIHLNREVDSKDKHSSENGLVGLLPTDFHLYINNHHLDLKEQNELIIKNIYQAGWFNKYLSIKE